MTDPATLATEDYLARLDRVAAREGLSRAERLELRSRTAEWIADRRADAVQEGRDVLAVVLDTIVDLGAPEALLTEALASGLGQHARAATRLTIAERTAVIGLAIGWMTAGIGWLVGVVALLRCARWTRTERVAAALVTLFVPGLAVQAGTSGTDLSAVNVGGFVALIALSTAAPLALVWRLRRRAGLLPVPTPSRRPPSSR